MRLISTVIEEGHSVVTYGISLREEFINFSAKFTLSKTGIITKLALSSYLSGYCQWGPGPRLLESKAWEDEEDLAKIGYLSRHFQSALAKPASRELADQIRDEILYECRSVALYEIIDQFTSSPRRITWPQNMREVEEDEPERVVMAAKPVNVPGTAAFFSINQGANHRVGLNDYSNQRGAINEQAYKHYLKASIEQQGQPDRSKPGDKPSVIEAGIFGALYKSKKLLGSSFNIDANCYSSRALVQKLRFKGFSNESALEALYSLSTLVDKIKYGKHKPTTYEYELAQGWLTRVKVSLGGGVKQG